MKRYIVLGCALIAFSACKNDKEKPEQLELNEKDKMEIKKEAPGEAWQMLLDEKDLDGWKAYNRDSISSQWTLENGVLFFNPNPDKRTEKEYLITEGKYKNFELSLEWKISEGGNSGIMWAVQEVDQYKEPYFTGPEIQILDNKNHPDAKNGLNRTAGALYDMVPPAEDATKPAGEWNKEVIHIDHKENKGWVKINGTRVTEFPLHGKKWKEMVQNSKFGEWEDFGANQTGHIALQDHDDKVWFRNIKIKELD
jgi:hypothetical protein